MASTDNTNPNDDFRTSTKKPVRGRTAETTVSVDRDADVGLREAHRRFGGIDVAATLIGMLAALAVLILVGGLIGAAIGAIGYQTGLKGNHTSLSVAGLVGGVVALLVAFFIGGWAAARIARYDGIRNGLMTAVWAVLLAAVLAALGAALGTKYNVFEHVPNLPNWFSTDALTAGAIASAAAAVIAMLVGGALGGARGERYHRRIDRLIADTRPGGISPRTQIVRPS
jgi:hypothetical protein